MLGFLSNRASAAHLALAAVAPLVLCKYFTVETVCVVSIWLAGIAALWAFMAPVKRNDERTPDARRRFLRHALGDPFFWVALALTVYAALVAVNGGVALAYDAELKLWRVTSPAAAMLPGGVAGTGGAYFAATLLVLVLYPAIVHSLDSRQAVYFALVVSVVTVTDAAYAYVSQTGVRGDSAVAYGLWAMVAAAAMFSADRVNRRPKELLSALALAGCFAALLFAGRPVVLCFFAGAVLLLALLFAGFMVRELGVMGVVRALLLLFVAAAFAAALYQWRSGDWMAQVPVWGSEADSILNRFAVRAWEANPWTGSGVGSFPLVAKMGATAEDWMTLGPLPDFGGNGWRLLLVERGMIGVLAVAVALGAMGYAWFRYARQRGVEKFAAAVPLLPLAVVAVSATLVFDSSALQAEAVVAFAALGAFSVNGGQ